jgi:hypothetical protein
MRGGEAMSKQANEPPFANTRKALADALAQIEGVLPGSVVVRHVRCGKQGCACKADPPRLHGPYIQWTRTVNGKTVTRLLSQEQLARYQPWFDNRKRLNDVIAKLEIASLNAFDAAERPSRNASPPRSAPTRRSERAT